MEFYFVNQRVYRVMFFGIKSFANSADAAKFLDSFTLTE